MLDLITVDTRLKIIKLKKINIKQLSTLLTSSLAVLNTTVFSPLWGLATSTNVPSDLNKSSSLTAPSGIKSTTISTSRPRVWSMVKYWLRSRSFGLTLAF